MCRVHERSYYGTVCVQCPVVCGQNSVSLLCFGLSAISVRSLKFLYGITEISGVTFLCGLSPSSPIYLKNHPKPSQTAYTRIDEIVFAVIFI